MKRKIEKDQQLSILKYLFLELFVKTSLGYLILLMIIGMALTLLNITYSVIIIFLVLIMLGMESIIMARAHKLVPQMLMTKSFQLDKDFLSDLNIEWPVKKTTHISRSNAITVGLLPKKSVIIVTEKLLKYKKDIIRAVLKHEIAHVKNKDILKLFLWSQVFNFFYAFLFIYLPDKVTVEYQLFALRISSVVIKDYLIGLVFIIFLILSSILVKAIELRADITSIQCDSDSENLMDALKSLGIELEKMSDELNRVLNRKSKIYKSKKIQRPKSFIARVILWLWSHPPLYIRIREIKNYKSFKGRRSLLFYFIKVIKIMFCDIFLS